MTRPIFDAGELEPGTVINIDNPSLLPPFEDAVARYLMPDMDPDHYSWGGRVPLDRLLLEGGRSGVHIGMLGPMVLSVMSNPYDALASAIERGWTKVPAAGRIAVLDPDLQRRFVGFAIDQDVYPVGYQATVSVPREVWYRPVPDSTGLEPVMRYVYRPKPLTGVRRAPVPPSSRRIDFRSRWQERGPQDGAED